MLPLEGVGVWLRPEARHEMPSAPVLEGTRPVQPRKLLVAAGTGVYAELRFWLETMKSPYIQRNTYIVFGSLS